MGNKALISVLFPASLQYIGTEAFADCINIKAIDLSACPELVTVGYRAFGGIDGLESLSFNGCSKLTTIDEYAFSNDFYIATIDFTGCTSLSTIGANAFNNVREALTTLDLSDCTSLTVIGKSSFKSLKKMTSLTLPENVEIIGMGAFYSCHSLETITLPASVDSIAPHSFGQPKAMKTVVCLGTDTRAAEMAFSNNTYISSPSTKPAEENYTDKGYTLVVPKGCADTYRAGIEWAKFPVRCRRRRCRHAGNRLRTERCTGEKRRGRRLGSHADPRPERHLPGKSGQRSVQSRSLNAPFLP